MCDMHPGHMSAYALAEYREHCRMKGKVHVGWHHSTRMRDDGVLREKCRPVSMPFADYDRHKLVMAEYRATGGSLEAEPTYTMALRTVGGGLAEEVHGVEHVPALNLIPDIRWMPQVYDPRVQEPQHPEPPV